jgi:adenylate cyclase
VFAAFILLSTLQFTPQWHRINGLFFDQISTIFPAHPVEPGIVIIAIDELSFAEIDQQWPWQRETHAQLVTALRKAGVRAVGFDVVFANPSQYGPEDDIALAGAALSDTVFAADISLVDTPQASNLVRTEALSILLSNGAHTGLANVQPDQDGVVRKFTLSEESLAYILLQTADVATSEDNGTTRRIQYFGPPNTYPRVSYYQALDPAAYLPPDMLKDKVVLVGYSLQAMPSVSTSDAFETPYTKGTGSFTSGVEIQATIFDNYKNDLFIANPPNWAGHFLLVLGCIFGALISRQKSIG